MVYIFDGGRFVARNGQVVTISKRKYRTASPRRGTVRNYPFWGDFNSPSPHRAGKKATYTPMGLFQVSANTSQWDLVKVFMAKAGGTYVTRNGKVVTLRARNSSKYPFEGDVASPNAPHKLATYTKDGLFQAGASSPLDLVRELVPAGRFNPPVLAAPPRAAAPATGTGSTGVGSTGPAPVVVVRNPNGSATVTKNGVKVTLSPAELAALAS